LYCVIWHSINLKSHIKIAKLFNVYQLITTDVVLKSYNRNSQVTWEKITEGLWTRLIPRIVLHMFLPFPTVVNSYNNGQITGYLVCMSSVSYLSVIRFHCTNTCYDDNVSLCFNYCISMWLSWIFNSRPLWI